MEFPKKPWFGAVFVDNAIKDAVLSLEEIVGPLHCPGMDLL